MVKYLGLRLWGENVIVLVVSSADKQRQRFYPGSGPSGGGKHPTSCLSVIDRGDYEVTRWLRRDDDLARALVVRVWLGP